MLAVLNWVAIGLLVVALLPAGLAWAGRVKFHRWLPAGQSRSAGRAFALLGLGALVQAVAQLVDGAARWAISSPGLALVVLGAVLVLRLRTREPAQSSG